MSLPIAEICPALLQALSCQQRLVLSAPPGAGKSTYLPLFLLQATAFAGKTIVMLEPRRLAAKTIATYLASQLGEAVGATVGYQIRFEQQQSSATRLLIVTEGVLIRKIQQDPELQHIDLLIFDEFHERSIQTDLALALALEVQQFNPALQLLLMSATLATAQLAEALQAPVLQSAGRSFPVAICYQAPTQEANWLQTTRLAWQAAQQHDGSILVFLPGQREISLAQQWLLQQQLPAKLQVFALIGSQSLTEQQQAIAPCATGFRKIVLATNIAETSLTIDGISVVVDSGLARQASYSPKLGFSALDTVQISQAAATQRAGRAGRLMPGTCYRLDTAEKWARRSAFTQPEILQADLLALRLDIASWGCQVADLFWLDPPPERQLLAAEQCLQLLGALDQQKQLTAVGRKLQQLPLPPRLAAMVCWAQQLEAEGHPGVTALAITMAVQLDQGKRLSSTDLASQLQLSGMAIPQRHQLCQQLGVRIPPQLPLELCAILLSRAFPDRIAQLRGQGYLLANGTGAQLAADDVLSGSSWLVVADLRLWQQQALISVAVTLQLSELLQYWQDDLSWQTQFGFDEQSGRFQAEQQLRLGQLVLKRQPMLAAIDGAARQSAWLELLARKGLSVLAWRDNAVQLQRRVALAKQLQPEAGWPDLSLACLAATASQWLGPYLNQINSLQQLQQLDLHQILQQQLSYLQQQQLASLLPASWCSVLGSHIALEYDEHGAVQLAIRLQEMFGQLITPQIAGGRVKVIITLLSPARRPLQVTQDLASFWQNAYQDVKKEMRGRYPKHYWPDDPAQATPTNKTKKAMK